MPSVPPNRCHARDNAAQRGWRVQVFTGAEVTTRHEHLLCYDVERTYPYLGSLEGTVALAPPDGGWVVVAHPLRGLTLGVSERRLADLLRAGPAWAPTAVEVLNPSVSGAGWRTAGCWCSTARPGA